MNPSNETIDAMIARMKTIGSSRDKLSKLAGDLEKIKLINGVNPNIPGLDVVMTNNQRSRIWMDIRNYVNSL